MSKVQPNHNRGIMQTGLGQPPVTLCSEHKTKLWKFRGRGGGGGGGRSKKLATL